MRRERTVALTCGADGLGRAPAEEGAGNRANAPPAGGRPVPPLPGKPQRAARDRTKAAISSGFSSAMK
ncbi:hypothetical protein GCM10022227_35930 [Streptomyces sedi]